MTEQRLDPFQDNQPVTFYEMARHPRHVEEKPVDWAYWQGLPVDTGAYDAAIEDLEDTKTHEELEKMMS